MDTNIDWFDWVLLSSYLLFIFVATLIAYWIFFAILEKIFGKAGEERSLTSRIISSVKKPTLLILLGLVALFCLDFLPLNAHVKKVISHILQIFLIAAVGYFLAAVAKGCYRHYIGNYPKEGFIEIERRSVITQVQFLYRAALFLIVTLSFAAILMTFPSIKNIGVGILGSAGIAGIALGIAARPILLNLMAGVQIAMTKVVKIGDYVTVGGVGGVVEQISLTQVILKIWDLRRMVVPISYFIDNSFENWSLSTTDLIGSVLLYVDPRVSVEKVREKLKEIVHETPLWDGRVCRLVVLDATEQSIQLRAEVSARNSSDVSDLRCHVREKLIEYLQKEHPEGLPRVRYENL